jgi:hypothetical protein
MSNKKKYIIWIYQNEWYQWLHKRRYSISNEADKLLWDILWYNAKNSITPETDVRYLEGYDICILNELKRDLITLLAQR